MNANIGNRAFPNANYYSVLGVGLSATEKEISKAYKELQRKYHTDKGGDNYISLLLNEAKRILLDRELRVHYDMTRNLDDIGNVFLNKGLRLPSSAKLSHEVLNSIEEWKLEFESIQLQDDGFESVAQIIKNTIQQNPIHPLNDGYKCLLCQRVFISEDEHFDQMLVPYLNEMLSSFGGIDTVFDFLRQKVGITSTNEVKDSTEGQNRSPTLGSTSSTEYQEILKEAKKLVDTGKKQEAMLMCLKLEPFISDSSEENFDANINRLLFEDFTSLATAIFEDDSYYRGEAYKAILRTFMAHFSNADEIHCFWREQLRTIGETENSLNAIHLILANLHYANDISMLDIRIFYRWALPKLAKLLRNSVDQSDFDLLSQILVNTNDGNVHVLEEFLVERGKLYDLNLLQNDYKAAISSIQGTIAKIQGNVIRALDHFEKALQAVVCSSPAIKNDILMMVQLQFQDTRFHSQILNYLTDEATRLGSLYQNRNCLDFKRTTDFPTFVPDLTTKQLFSIQVSANSSLQGQARIARRNEEAIQLRMKTPISKALGYFDISSGIDCANGKIICFMQAISHLLEVMSEEVDLGANYAYRNVIEEYCIICFSLSRNYEGPNMHILVQRFLLSALLRSNQILASGLLCTEIKLTNTRTTQKIMTSIGTAFIAEAFQGIFAMAKLYPFTTTPMQSVTDQILRENCELRLLTDFIHTKTQMDYHPLAFPRQIYSYAEFDSIWRNWGIKDGDFGTFEDARLDTMNSMLEAREWDMIHVEEIMQWRLIRRTEAGWMNNEEIGLDFDGTPDSEMFSACRGYEIDDASGEITLLLEQGTTKLFTLADIIDVFEKNISSGIFTLENPDPKLSSHPFQEYKYYPKGLKDTDYLNDLLHVDLLLKQITTGMEINAIAPFELRPISEGFLQRLPKPLQEKLKPIMERRRDPINTSSSDAHRFWIQVNEVDGAIVSEPNKTVVQFGDARVQVLTRLLKRKPNGEYMDDDEEKIRSSAEAQLAEVLTEDYDEIGAYFPILLRLKEMTKLSLIQKKLSALLTHYKTELSVLQGRSIEQEVVHEGLATIEKKVRQILTNYRDTPWDPPHPIYNEVRVNSDYRETLALNNLIGKEHQLAPGEETRVKTSIRNGLRAADERRFDHTSAQIASLFEVNVTGVCPLIRGWFDRNTNQTEQLIHMCIGGLKQKKLKELVKQIEQIEILGIKKIEANGEVELGTCGECTWVPASFCNKFKKPSQIPEPEVINEPKIESQPNDSKLESTINGNQQKIKEEEKKGLMGPGTTCAIENEKEPKKEGDQLVRYPVGNKSIRRKDVINIGNATNSSISDLKAENGAPTAPIENLPIKKKIAPPTGRRPPRIYGGVITDAALNIVSLLPQARLVSLGSKAIKAARGVALSTRIGQKLSKVKFWPNRQSSTTFSSRGASSRSRGTGKPGTGGNTGGSGSGSGKSGKSGGGGGKSGGGGGSGGGGSGGGGGSAGSGAGCSGSSSSGPPPGSVKPPAPPNAPYNVMSKHTSKGTHAHHLSPHAYTKQVGIPKGKGISVATERGIHSQTYKNLDKIWRDKGLLKGKQKTPTLDPANPSTHPRSILGQSVQANRQALKSRGLYGPTQRQTLYDAMQAEKNAFPNLYENGKFNPMDFKPPTPGK